MNSNQLACRCLLFPLWLFGSLFAQDDPVLQRFESREKIQWIRKFDGLMDDVFEVKVVLASDGKNCLGTITYPKSNFVQNLEGSCRDKRIELVELNNKDVVSAYFTGSLDNSTLRLGWSNTNRTVSRNLLAREAAKSPARETSAPGNQWIRIFKGIIDKQNVSLVLQQNGGSALSGSLYMPENGALYAVSGTMTDQNSSNISLKENGKTVGKLVIAARDGNICQMVYDIPDHKKGSILIRNMSEVSMEARTYVDYFFSYDFLVPKTDHLVFNLYMQNLVTPWINKCKLHSQTLQEKYDEQAPSLRALHSASGWFEVTYLTQDAISGVYHIISNWMEEDQHIPVNYSFREGKEITLEELFDPKRNYGNFITNYINGENGKLKIKPNLDRKAGKNERFILRHSGICFVQSEDMVNGRREILMPYDKADEFLRNSSLVKNLRRN